MADRTVHRAAVREVEAATRTALRRQIAGDPAEAVRDTLIDARQRYVTADQHWQQDASRLLLLDR